MTRHRSDRRPRRPSELGPSVFLPDASRQAYFRAGAQALSDCRSPFEPERTETIFHALRAAERAAREELRRT